MNDVQQQPDLSLQTREYLLVPLAVTTAALFMFGMPPIGIPMIAAVLGRLVYAGSPGLAGATVALCALGTAAYGVLATSAQETVQSTAAVVTTGLAPSLMVAGTSAVLLWAVRALSRLSARRVFWTVTGGGFASYLVAWFVGAAAQGASLAEVVSAQVDVALEQVTPMVDAGISQSVMTDLQEIARVMVVQSWPGTSLVLVMLGAGLGTLFVSRLARAHGLETDGPRPLDRLDVNWLVSVPFAAGFAVVVWLLAQDAQASVAGGLALNAVIVSAAVLVAQGFAVSESLLKRFRFGILLRLLVYGVLFWLVGLLPMLFLLGVVDLWVNFRKLPRRASAAAGEDPGSPRDGADSTDENDPEGPFGPGVE